MFRYCAILPALTWTTSKGVKILLFLSWILGVKVSVFGVVGNISNRPLPSRPYTPTSKARSVTLQHSLASICLFNLSYYLV